MGETNSKQAQSGQLEDLKALVNLHGRLTIKIFKFCPEDASKVREGGYLLSKQHLKSLAVKFYERDVKEDVQEALLEGLHPNGDLRWFELSNYEGVRLPRWASWKNSLRTFLPCLVSIRLDNLPRV